MFVYGTMIGRFPVVMCDGPGGDNAPLPSRTDLWAFEEDGFMDWREPGGPRLQLALAIIAYATGHQDAALHLCEAFAVEALDHLNADGWSICIVDVLVWCVTYMTDQLTGNTSTRRWHYSTEVTNDGK